MMLTDYLKSVGIEYKEQVSLSAFTGMSLSGTIPLVAWPSSVEQLTNLYVFLLHSGHTFEFVGSLSNTYLCEGFRRDIVVKTTKVRSLSHGVDSVTVGCGYSLTKLSKTLIDAGVAGYEGLVGIPGTIGAAVINNSGAFGCEMSQVVRAVRVVDLKGEEKTYTCADMHYGFRDSVLKGEPFGVVTAVVLDTSRKVDACLLQQKAEEYARVRKKIIDGRRKSLGSTIAFQSLPMLWDNHRRAFYIKKLLFAPFKYTRWAKRMRCYLDFLVLGNPGMARHCDSIGRFCWTRETDEKTFFEYIDFIRSVSLNRVVFEIEFKK